MMKSLPISVINQNHGPKIQLKKDSEVQENWTKLIDGKVAATYYANIFIALKMCIFWTRKKAFRETSCNKEITHVKPQS